MSNDKAEYLNFPIQLLSGLLINTTATMNNILYYATYGHALKLEHGTMNQKIKCSGSHFSAELKSVDRCLKTGKALYDDIPEGSPKVGLRVSMFWDFYTNEKNEYDKACFLCFLALKSIIGSKAYCKATNLYLWSRMDGKPKTVNEVSDLSTDVRKYANRYQAEKIKDELIFNWGLIHYSSHTRGFYVSFKMSLENLILEAEKKRESNKKNEQKRLLNEAKQKALERLKLTAP